MNADMPKCEMVWQIDIVKYVSIISVKLMI